MSHLNSKSPNTNSKDDCSNSDTESPLIKINAFQFMMNSRHKIIGSNSSGKERKEPYIKSPKVIENEKEKLNKRKAIFEDWAEKKGGTKRKLADEAKEKYIHKTMHKRAKRLKNMLNIIDNELNRSSQSDDDSNSDITKTKKRIIKICDSENSNDVNDSEEILQSCEKNKEQKQTGDSNEDNKGNHSHKKRKHKRSLSLKKSINDKNKISKENNYILEDFNDNCDEIFPETSDSVTPISTNRKTLQMKLINDSNSNINKNEEKNECFSPRSWRMKVKLLENTNDEENSNEAENIIVIDDSSEKPENKLKELKKNVKLAPLFLRHQSKEALNAKKDFLHSGVPTKVKKLMTHSKSFRDTEYSYSLFPKISHVQQKSCDENFWDLPNIPFNFIEKNSALKLELCNNLINIGTFSDCKSMNNISLNSKRIYGAPQKYNNLQEIVKEMKKMYSEYPIYKTFRLLYQQYQKHCNTIEPQIIKESKPSPKRKKGRPKKKINESLQKSSDETNETSSCEMLMWTEKYKPQSHEEIIGNFAAVKELKSWLESWIMYSEDQKSSKRRNRLNSNTSDDFCSDSTTKDTDILPQNLITLIGPFGSGKTSSVYALCNELNINIIEINASSKRPGKKVLTELQEATQSHQVKNTDSKSIGSFFQKNPKSEDDINKKLSLLLVEDVDIVFEDQDDGFISAIITLATTSKRPIILTSTDKKSPYLQKFISQHSVIYFNPLSDKILSPWLQILCLIEGVRTDGVKIDKLVQWCKGDVRKIILQLQFWIQTGGHLKISANSPKILDISYKLEDEDFAMKDECSNFSWMDENSETNNKKSNTSHEDSFIPYEHEKENWKLFFPVNLGVFWWNIPSILGCNSKINIEKSESIGIQNKAEKFDKKSIELNQAFNLLENLVFADVMYTKHKIESDHEPIYNYWQTSPENSLIRNENFRMYNNNDNTSMELVHWLLENSVKQCTNLFETKNTLDLDTTVPFFEERKWRTKRHRSMKDVLNIVPTFCILDRKAICEDYQTILRTICRIENQRFTNNGKRKSRFYHYFKTLNIYLNDSTYLTLCESLEKIVE